MMFVQTWGDVFAGSLKGIWMGVSNIVPSIIVALIIFAIGWIFASLIEKIIENVFKTLKIDSALKTAGLEDVIERSGYKLNSGAFVGGLIRWFVIVVFLVASFNVLGLSDVNNFLGDVVLTYLPKVIIAVLVLMIAAVLAEAVSKIVVASARAAHIHVAGFLGKIARWAIWIVAILSALDWLGLSAGPLQTIFIGLVAALALALGLSFGLGCKDHAGKLLEKVVRDVTARD